MKIVFSAADNGMFLTIGEIHKLLPYTCAFGSFRRSLEFLEKSGVIFKQKEGRCVFIKPTLAAYKWFNRMS